MLKEKGAARHVAWKIERYPTQSDNFLCACKFDWLQSIGDLESIHLNVFMRNGKYFNMGPRNKTTIGFPTKSSMNVSFEKYVLVKRVVINKWNYIFSKKNPFQLNL